MNNGFLGLAKKIGSDLVQQQNMLVSFSFGEFQKIKKLKKAFKKSLNQINCKTKGCLHIRKVVYIILLIFKQIY